MSTAKPLETTEELFAFAANNHLPGTLMFSREIGALLPGDTVTLFNDRQLRRFAAGERVQGKLLRGPIPAETVAKAAKARPYALLSH